jgi:hypothetical protein
MRGRGPVAGVPGRDAADPARPLPAAAARVVRAHGGTLEADGSRDGALELLLTLPKQKPEARS